MPTPTDDRPDLLTVIADRESAADLEAHLTTPHLEGFTARLGELLDADGLTLTRLRRVL